MLEHVSANHVDGEPGLVTYTQWLDAAGKLQADLTVTKLGDERFWVVASDTAHRHVETGSRPIGEAHAHVADMTAAYAQLNVQGPRSRELISSRHGVDMSNEAFPFRGARELDIGLARVLCLRITYLGELGYELYIPTEQALHVYDRLVEAGATIDLVHAGLKTLASCRMEKGYRDYGHDIDNTDTVLEAGLGFAVDLEEARLHRQGRGRGPESRRAAEEAARADPRQGSGADAVSRRAVLRDGIPLGYVRAASYGHTLGGAVGLAMSAHRT